MMDLYLTPAEADLEKTAGMEVALPEDANSWTNEVMQELYKQVPYISDFAPHVVMDRVDAERGYGFGHVEVGNKTEIPSSASPQAQEMVGIHSVRIPIIIKDRKLQPFDVLVTEESKMLPLTEKRLREALFRPQAFDVTSRTPGDMSMIGQLYPPYRQNYGFAGGGVGMSAGMGKQSSVKEASADIPVQQVRKEKIWKTAGEMPASSEDFHHQLQQMLHLSNEDIQKLQTQPETQKTASTNLPNSSLSNPNSSTKIKDVVPGFKFKTGSILPEIAKTLNEEDVTKFAGALSDPALQATYVKNGHAVHESASLILDTPRISSEKRAAAFPHMIRPTVVQITREKNAGYKVKAANHHTWEPITRFQGRGEIIKAFGEKVALAADLTGSVTIADGPDAKEESPEENNAELVTKSGIYKVHQSEDGKELVGFVFPNLLDLDGTALPISLFTNGSASAVQAEIAGELVGPPKNPPVSDTAPGQHGVFFRTLPNGGVEATIPMEMLACVTEADGTVRHHVELFDGRQVFLSVQPNIQNPTMVEEGSFLLPADCRWMQIGDSAPVALVSHPEDFNKAASASREFASVTIRAGGPSTFSIEGFPVEKIARDQRSFIGVDDALFLLGGLGTDLDYASEKLAEAVASSAPVQVRIGRSIKLASEAREDATVKAASRLALLPILRRDLFKEAAFIPDPTAVDTVLSIGFINPENILTFVGHLPQMELSQSKLCELLVAARLGLQEVPVSALEKSIKSLEEVIDGLKILAFQKN